MTEVSFEGVSVRLGGVPVLTDVDLTIPGGSLMALVGPSGSGKTTMLRLIAGLARPDSGSVSVGGTVIDRHDPRPAGVAMVFQEDSLYDHLDVGGNLRFPLTVSGAPEERIEHVSRGSAGRMRVARFWRRRPKTLSGGERGLVATARAISRDGLRVLLLDEPLAHADRHVRRAFRLELRRLHDTEGVTTVLSTNDQEEAMAVADLLAVVIDGRVAQVGSPRSVFDSPESADVASFVGVVPMNLVPGALRRDGDRTVVEIGHDRVVLGAWPVGVRDGCRVVVGIHAHELTVAPPGAPFDRVLHVTVGRVEDVGAHRNVLFGLGSSPGGSFVMVEDGPDAPRAGDRLEVTWPPEKERLFRADTGSRIVMPG